MCEVEIMIKDIVGNPINLGDIVAYNPAHYKGLKTGTITSFTPKGCRVDGTAIKTGVVKIITPNN